MAEIFGAKRRFGGCCAHVIIRLNHIFFFIQKSNEKNKQLILHFSSMLAENPQNAYDVLNKRKSKTQQIDRILEMLRTKIDSKQ